MGTRKGTKKGTRPPPPKIPDALRDVLLDLLLPLTRPGPFEPEVFDHWLAFYEARYAATQNPIFVWEAIAQAIANNRALPPWVLLYLARVASAFHDMSRAQIPQEEIAPAVYRALDFKATKGVNPFRLISATSHDLVIACEVWEQIREGKKPDLAFDDVARAHPARCEKDPRCQSISRTTVYRCWEDHKSQFPT